MSLFRVRNPGILFDADSPAKSTAVVTGQGAPSGGSLLYGMQHAIADHLGVPARVADDPLTAVARGTGIFLDKLDVFSRVLACDEDE